MNVLRKVMMTVVIACGFGISVNAQKVVEQKISQGRLIEPSMQVLVKPQIVDLKVSSQRNEWSYFYTMLEVEALGSDEGNVRKSALFNAMRDAKADVIVAASFNMFTTTENGERGFKVEVIGYPAVYSNWRTMGPGDEEWVRTATTLGTRESQATTAISK